MYSDILKWCAYVTCTCIIDILAFSLWLPILYIKCNLYRKENLLQRMEIGVQRLSNGWVCWSQRRYHVQLCRQSSGHFTWWPHEQKWQTVLPGGGTMWFPEMSAICSREGARLCSLFQKISYLNFWTKEEKKFIIIYQNMFDLIKYLRNHY